MNRVLVDSSVWIRFFRQANSLEAKELDDLLGFGAVAICPPVQAKIVSAAVDKRNYQQLQNLLGALVVLEPPDDIWTHITELRFRLAKQGFQASLVDLWIALTAQPHQVPLWTLDKDFNPIASATDLTLYSIQ